MVLVVGGILVEELGGRAPQEVQHMAMVKEGHLLHQLATVAQITQSYMQEHMVVGMHMKCDITKSDNSAEMIVHHRCCTTETEDHGDCQDLSSCQMLHVEEEAVQVSLPDFHQQIQGTGR